MHARRRRQLPRDALLRDSGLRLEWNYERRYHVLADDMSSSLLHRQLHRLLFRYNTQRRNLRSVINF